jgi:DNA-directed RNA polymerase subunit RPC12/RpoP
MTRRTALADLPLALVAPKHACQQCGHAWIPRQQDPPARCPKCQSRRWWEPKLEVTPAGTAAALNEVPDLEHRPDEQPDQHSTHDQQDPPANE